MNFLKGSLFRRNTEPEEPEPMEESGGGILAVWGSPGCGKTVTAVKIAKHLAAQKKNTVLLLCDMTAPMMPCICPPSELAVDRSLGSIFAAQHISVNLIKHNLTTLKRLPHLTMLGLRKKENEYTYAPCTKQQAEELIRGLREIVPYVVIDCSSYIANDILSAVALMEADSVLQLASCDLKSVGYLIRRLTPLECERLQGFPDGWTDIPDASDSARYKALGNSVAIPCVEFIMGRIAAVLRAV